MRTKGFFVEFGAYDGVKNSNTKALKDSFSWHGVCIEPDSLNFRLLSYYRPRCRRRNVPVSSVGESHETFVSAGIMGGIFGGMGGTTGIQRLRSSRMSERSISVTMPTFNLTSVLDDVDAPRTIDYLSLDVEGNELGVLAGHPGLTTQSMYFVVLPLNTTFRNGHGSKLPSSSLYRDMCASQPEARTTVKYRSKECACQMEKDFARVSTTSTFIVRS